MPRVHIIYNDPEVPLDRFAHWLSVPGVELVEHHLPAGDQLPDTDVDGVVVLGGRQNAFADQECPFLPALRRYLVRCLAADTPVLGICLGAQLIGAAAGAEVTVSDPRGPEQGYVQIRGTSAGLRDAVLGPALSAGEKATWVPVMHHDAVTHLPAEAELLAVSDTYIQAFRVGQAVAVQFHPEASPELLEHWAQLSGEDPAQILAQATVADPIAAVVGQTLACAWIDSLTGLHLPVSA